MPHEFCQHSVNKKLKYDAKRRKAVKGKSPGQRLFLSKRPGQRTAPSFPRTEEARGSNPLTSTKNRCSAGVLARLREFDRPWTTLRTRIGRDLGVEPLRDGHVGSWIKVTVDGEDGPDPVMPEGVGDHLGVLSLSDEQSHPGVPQRVGPQAGFGFGALLRDSRIAVDRWSRGAYGNSALEGERPHGSRAWS